MLKIEDVKAGDELVCVDRDEFDKCHVINKEINSFVVSRLRSSGVVVSGDYIIYSNELKYFKKKEQSQQYTFDDLIDVSTKAFKDRAIFSVGITICAVSIKLHDKSEEVFTMMDIDEGIEFIQSLYKETFVIECGNDLNKIKREVSSIVLSNGEDIIDDVKFSENKPYFTNGGVSWVRVPFSVLKGATVEQKRGRDD